MIKLKTYRKRLNFTKKFYLIFFSFTNLIGLSQHVVTNYKQVIQLLEEGIANR